MRLLIQKIKDNNIFYFLLLFIILFITYFKLIKGLNSYTFNNDLGSNWIYEDHIKKSISQFGQYPLWINSFFSGFPIDASNLAALFYPLNLIFILVPLKIGFNFLTLLHVYLIGIFSFLLSYYGFRQSKAAAFIVSISIMLGPKLMNHNYFGHINLIESTPWLILSILLFIRSIEKKSIYLAISCGLSLALVITVFSIFYVYALFSLIIYLFIHLIWNIYHRKPLKEQFKGLLFPSITLLSSFIFSSAFLISFLIFSSQSLRTKLGFWEGAFPSIFRDNLIQLLYLFPHRFHDSETLIYIGIPTLSLAILGLITNYKKKKVIFLLFLAFFALTVSFGANEIFYKIYYRLIPIFQFMRAPLRIWILFIISIGLLAGYGTDYLINKFQRKKMIIIFSLIPLIFTSLWIYNRDYLKFTDYTSKSVDNLTLVPRDQGRIYCLNNCFATAEGLSRDYEFSSGGEVVLLNDYYSFMRLAGGFQYNSYSISVPPYQVFDEKGIFFEKQKPNPKLLGLSNTRYIISRYELQDKDLRLLHQKDEFYLYENSLVLPRVFLVPNASYYRSLNQHLEADFKKEVLIEGEGKNVKNPGEFKELKFEYYSPNKLIVNAKLENNAYLVVSDTFYSGWKAYDNSTKIPIYKANGIFRTVALKAGDHKIVFEYFPDWLKIGLAVSSLSAAAFLGYSFV